MDFINNIMELILESGYEKIVLTIGIIILAWIADVIAKRVLSNIISRVVKHTKTNYDDILLEKGVFKKLAHLAPAIVIYILLPLVLGLSNDSHNIFMSLVTVWIIWIVVSFANAFASAMGTIYQQMPVSENRPITGYLQLLKILIYISAALLSIQVLFGINMGDVFTGLGAMAAILLLVFKDTILGLVASVQISGNKMVKPGDWIEMPSFSADGTVLEITLNTVKVQNWDKTISTIPTYALVTNSFKNWKGMEESGGRRIKRAINIDTGSIKFCSDDLIDKLNKFHLLKNDISDRTKEISEYNTSKGFDANDKINGRGMTNIGLFRRYLEAYLDQHPKIHTNMTFLVRQLQSTEKGLPLEIYVFSNDQAWANYEAIQADIFDHIFAILPEFELRAYQQPSGFDVQLLSSYQIEK